MEGDYFQDALLSAPPIRLEVNKSHFYMEDHHGVLDFRVQNIGPDPIRGLKLQVESGIFSQPCVRIFHHMEPGSIRVHKFRAKPAKGDAGENLVDIKLQWKDAEKTVCLMAQHSISVLQEQKTPPNIAIDMSNWFGGQIEKFGFGQEFSVRIQDLIQKEAIRSPNDLLKSTVDLPADYEEVELVPDYQGMLEYRKEAESRRRIHREFGDKGFPTDCASLRFIEAETRKPMLLVSKSEISFGRQRGANDIVLRVLPRSEENDAKSLKISKIGHFRLCLDSRGISIIDEGSTNGTFVFGGLLKGTRSVPRDQKIDIDVARVLNLRMTFFSVSDFFSFEKSAYSEIGLGESNPFCKNIEGIGIDCLRIERMECPYEEQYIVLLRQAIIGSEGRLPIVVPGIERFHAKILYLGKQYYLENLVDCEKTKVNGVNVGPKELVPLAPGMQVSLGGRGIEFREFQQVF